MSSKSKPTKPLTSHIAMIELKQKILTSLTKLADRDTNQIAITDLENTIQTISPDALPMLLNTLYDYSSSTDPKPAVKKESLRLISFTCQTHPDLTATHLCKIVGNVVKRLKDTGDSAVRDACRDLIGELSRLYLKGDCVGGIVGVFVKPLFEVMGEQSKGVQSGAALCMARMVECAGSEASVGAFQKMCPRIYKLLSSPNFLAKSSLLSVVASLSQVGAIQQQSLSQMLQGIHECLKSTDWATRKAAADTLISLALHSSELVKNEAESTLALLEACRFDKIKPVRDSMMEACKVWKKIAGNDDGTPEKKRDNENSEPLESTEKNDMKSSNPKERKLEQSAKDSSNESSPSNSVSKENISGMVDKSAMVLKRKPPALSDKQLNPEFFQKLETRGSVEVVVPRKPLISSNFNGEEDPISNERDLKERSDRTENSQIFYGRINGVDSRQRTSYDSDVKQREPSGNHAGFSKSDGQSEGSFINTKGNWLAIQRQLSQLERQQTHLMNMLQDFMGGSHDSMITLENRVRGLERVVEEMARDLSLSSGRGNSFTMGYEGSNRMFGKYNGYPDYLTSKYNGRMPFGERFPHSETSSVRGRGASWRPDAAEAWDFTTYGASRNEHAGFRRAPRGGSEHEIDQVGSRRAWDKGAGPVRFGEGPSARSVWQASKDEATLEAIRVAGEDGKSSQTRRVAIPERVAEAIGDDTVGEERDPIWTSWGNAMDALQVGDVDSAFAEVLSTGDDFLLVKLMDRSGPVIDQLSNEVALEALSTIGQFLLDQNLFDICLSWIQQLLELVLENGPDFLGIPMEMKKEILLNFHEASSTTDPPEDWEGSTPDQLLMQLASAWEIDLQQFGK